MIICTDLDAQTYLVIDQTQLVSRYSKSMFLLEKHAKT